MHNVYQGNAHHIQAPRISWYLKVTWSVQEWFVFCPFPLYGHAMLPRHPNDACGCHTEDLLQCHLPCYDATLATSGCQINDNWKASLSATRGKHPVWIQCVDRIVWMAAGVEAFIIVIIQSFFFPLIALTALTCSALETLRIFKNFEHLQTSASQKPSIPH